MALDVAVSSRLATVGYAAPDNATIAAIAGYVDIEIAAILADLATLKDRLTVARAGYLDNLSAGAVALQANVDDLEGRLFRSGRS